MIKKINIFLVLLLLLVSVGAVSAADEGNSTDMLGNEAIQDAIEVSVDDIDYAEDVLTLDDSSSQISAASHTIKSGNYDQFFDSNGNLISSDVNSGDTIKLDGSFSGKSFIFNKTVNIVGTSTNNMKNSIVTLLSGASGSSITNLKITNTKDETYGIFLNSASNCTIQDCKITTTDAKHAYPICIANNANHNKVINNDLKTSGQSYGHGTRSTATLIISGSHYNAVSDNKIEVDDANGIYLSDYAGGPLNGGNSNHNKIYNNTIHYNVLPTSWAYGIQVMGSYNEITDNKVTGAYRGISTTGFSNNITHNTINHITGADYQNPTVEVGGEFGIVGSYNSIISDNDIIDSKIISTGAGISVIDNSIVENNRVYVTEKGRGIVAAGSNVIIRNNVISTQTGSGVYERDDGSGLLVDGNTITSDSGVGVLLEKLSSKSMPKNVTIINNIISTSNEYAIDVADVEAGTSNTDYSSNTIIGSGLINSPVGVIDNSKPTYIYTGTTHTITPENIRQFINDNGGLTSKIKDKDILNFEGTFSNEVIFINKQVKITGENPIFYNSTFKVTCGNVLIENLIIINKKTERVNAWGIYVNQAPGVRIQNNNISVTDPKAAYAIYVLESTDVDVWNNELYSEGDYLTFTLLAYGCEDCNFEHNTIHTKGTGEVYNFKPVKCIDGNEITVGGKSVCIDGNEVFIGGNRFCLDGNEACIDGVTYCLDGNELCIDGVTYCFDGNEICIDGKTYCLDGNEFCIDGVTYCIDGNEFCIDGKTYCLDGNEFCIDGVTYCIDGNEVCIDGKTYCFDGNEVCIDGKTYCFDGNENQVSGAHVVSEIYQTYGILLLYSSTIVVDNNNVDVTSKLSKKQPTTGLGASTNSIVGIDLYFNCHNNIISNNIVNVEGKDNYIYGMGVLGYTTGHSAPNGQGAINNAFTGNTITLKGVYCVEGIIIGDESEDTLIEDNVINIESDACAYGIYFEMSQKSTAKDNVMTLNSQAIYGIEGYSSSDNVISNNTVNANGKEVYGALFANGKNNTISRNKINANGNGESINVTILDALSTGNAGIYLMANSTNNYIENNEITSAKGFAVLLDDAAINNRIVENKLDSEKGIGNDGVSNSNGNTVYDNYKYEATLDPDTITVPYLGTAEFSLDFGDKNLDGGIVKFYDFDGIEFAQPKISKGVASAKYPFGESDIPSQYVFSAELFKEYYKVSTFDIIVKVRKSNIVITLDPVTIQAGSTGNIVAKVSDEVGNPIKGATVKFNRTRFIGNAISNDKGVATLSSKVLPGMTEGNYSISAQVDGFGYYNTGTAYSTLTVPKGPLGTVIVIATTFSRYSTDFEKKNELTCEHGAYFYGTLYDVNGNPLSNKTVQITINGAFYNVTTDKKGQAGLQVNIAAANVYTYSLFFQGDKDYKASLIASSKLTVVKKPVSIIANNMAFKTSAKTKTVTVALNTIKNPYDNKMYIRTGNAVTLKVNGKTYTSKTKENGVATFNIDITKAGTYSATVSFAGSNVYESASKTIKIVISSSPSKNKALSGVGVGFAAPSIASDGKLNIVGNYANYLANQEVTTSNYDSSKKDTKIVVDATFTRLASDYYAGERGANFTAILKDANNKPLAGKTVQIAINGAIYNITSNSKGEVGLQINMNTANVYTYALTFSGDDKYNPAVLASSKLTLTKKATSITASAKTFKASAKTKSISVTLGTVKNPYDGKTYLKSGKTLTLKVNGQTYTAKTNAKGVATFNIKLTKRGTFTAAISFDGDKTYSESSKKITVKIQ